jgi:hypothetical protein
MLKLLDRLAAKSWLKLIAEMFRRYRAIRGGRGRSTYERRSHSVASRSSNVAVL